MAARRVFDLMEEVLTLLNVISGVLFNYDVLIVQGLNDFRSISLESGMFPHTYGSSRVKLSGVSEVLCSIKVSR